MTTSVASWLRNRKTRPVRRPAFRPRLTVLEDRSVPSFGWAAAVGGSYQLGNSVATDAAGNVYMTGAFTSSFTPAGSNVTLTPAGGTDLFVAKYTRSGAFAWAASLGVAQSNSMFFGGPGNGIAVDGTGTSVYVVGENAGYLAQLNAGTGAMNWSRTLPGTGANSVAVDGAGAGAAYVTSHGSAGSTHFAYVTKLGADGTQQWQDTISGYVGYFGAYANVAVGGNAVYVGGVYFNHATFAIGSRNYSITAAQNLDAAFVLKVSSDNAYGWVQTFQGFNGKKGSQGTVTANTIAADSAGNVYAFGNFLGKVNFAASTTTATGSWVLDAAWYNGADVVTKLSPTGSFVWAKQFGPMPGGINGVADAIAVDAAGAVYLTGNFTGTVGFNPTGGGTLTTTGYARFVSKLDTNGTFQWAVQASSGSGGYAGGGIAVDGFGDVYASGYIAAGTYDFDPTHTYGDNRDLVTTATGGGFLWQITQP